jgi:hypothetical protein
MPSIFSSYYEENMPTYIHERRDWPHFRWAEKALTGELATVRHHQGRLLGRMESLGFKHEKKRRCGP